MDQILPERERQDRPVELPDANQVSSASAFAVGQRPEIPTNMDTSRGVVPTGSADANGLTFNPQTNFQNSPDYVLDDTGKQKLSRTNDFSDEKKSTDSQEQPKVGNGSLSDKELDELKPYPKGMERNKT